MVLDKKFFEDYLLNNKSLLGINTNLQIKPFTAVWSVASSSSSTLNRKADNVLYYGQLNLAHNNRNNEYILTIGDSKSFEGVDFVNGGTNSDGNIWVNAKDTVSLPRIANDPPPFFYDFLTINNTTTNGALRVYQWGYIATWD